MSMARPFIVGMRRSGTTLLRLMLDSHSSLAIPPETYFLATLLNLEKSQKVGREDLIDTITTSHVWPDFQLSAGALREKIERLDPFSIRDGVRAFYRLYAETQGKAGWGDKTPPYDVFITSLHRLLPEARFIILIRDGRDVALSIKQTWFGQDQTLQSMAQEWTRRVRESLRQARANEEICQVVRYEQLVRNPYETLQRICGFLNIDFESSMLEYYERTPHRLAQFGTRLAKNGMLLTKSQRLAIHAKTHRPPDRHNTEKWRRQMNPEDQAAFLKIAGEQLEALGYESR